jgi:hypothetical protein
VSGRYAALVADAIAANGDHPDDPGLPPSIIPADWWDARPILRAVRDHAVARFVPPDGLLADVLAELALRTPNDVYLPPVIGGRASLNFGVVKVGETGTGKTVGGRLTLADCVAGELTIEACPLSTGEGITMALCDPPIERGDRPQPHGRPILVFSDEGRVLEQLCKREGSRLLGDLCTAISGGPLGQGNATQGLHRYVPANSYRLAVVLGIQPKYLSGPLADVDGGLPQRFWFVRLSGHLLDPDHPTAPPPKFDLPHPADMPFPGDDRGRLVIVPDATRDQIRREHVERLHAMDRGEPVAGRSHRNLLRLRLATLLAFADGRPRVIDDDWQLALPLVESSDEVIVLGEAMRADAARPEPTPKDRPATPSPPTSPWNPAAPNASPARSRDGCGPSPERRAATSLAVCRPPLGRCVTTPSSSPSNADGSPKWPRQATPTPTVALSTRARQRREPKGRRSSVRAPTLDPRLPRAPVRATCENRSPARRERSPKRRRHPFRADACDSTGGESNETHRRPVPQSIWTTASWDHPP